MRLHDSIILESPTFDDLVNGNTYCYASFLTDQVDTVEAGALTSALSSAHGVIFAASQYSNLPFILSLCNRFNRKVHHVRFEDFSSSDYGLNPFLNLNAEEIAGFFLDRKSDQFDALVTALASHKAVKTPSSVLEILLQNQALFVEGDKTYQNAFAHLNNLNFEGNPFNNIDLARNFDLVSALKSGDVVIFDALPDQESTQLAIQYFMDIFLLSPATRKLYDLSNTKNIFIVSSNQSAIRDQFSRSIFAIGRKINVNGLFIDFQNCTKSNECIHIIYDNSQFKIIPAHFSVDSRFTIKSNVNLALSHLESGIPFSMPPNTVVI